MMNDYTVYMHIFPNGKKYIGITCQKPEKRWQNGYGYVKQDFMWRAIQKYKWHNIEHKILYTNLSKEEAEKIEIDLIKEYATNKDKYGYNITNGGNTLGTMDETTKMKISLAHTGKPRSEETKEKLRISNLGKALSDEVKVKISKALKGRNKGANNPFYGKKHTEELKKKWSENRKGQNNPNWGKKMPEEVKMKFILAKSIPIICVETGEKYCSMNDAERKTNIFATSIARCLKNKQKTAGGYHWIYAKEGHKCQKE